MGANPAGALESAAPMITNRNTMVITTSQASAAVSE